MYYICQGDGVTTSIDTDSKTVCSKVPHSTSIPNVRSMRCSFTKSEDLCDLNFAKIGFHPTANCSGFTTFADDIGVCPHADYITLDQCTSLWTDSTRTAPILGVDMLRLIFSDSITCNVYEEKDCKGTAITTTLNTTVGIFNHTECSTIPSGIVRSVNCFFTKI